MNKTASGSASDSVREYAHETYVSPARRRQDKTFSINVGQVHKAVALHNRVPLVCQALESEKFLGANSLRLLSKTGPPSGQSTTVTYTYEFIDREETDSPPVDPWLKVRGIAKDLFAALGGGEAFIREERANFYGPGSDESAKRR